MVTSSISRIYRLKSSKILIGVGAYGDFVNLEDLLAQSSKILIGVGFAYVYS